MPSGDIHNNLTDRGGGIVRAFIFKFEKVTVTKHVQRSRRGGGVEPLWDTCHLMVVGSFVFKVRQVFEIFVKVANMVLANEPVEAHGCQPRIAYPVSAQR